jgi:Fic family protein
MESKDFQQKIIAILENMDRRLEQIQNDIGNLAKPADRSKKTNIPLDVDAMLSLRDHLRETAMSVSAKGSATAEEVSAVTGRSRAAESDYLNQLVKMGYLSKKREGKIVYFSV